MKMNIDQCIADLLEAKCLHERDLRIICEKAKEIFLEESNVQPVSSPVTVCGDIHGQFYDVLELFRTGRIRFMQVGKSIRHATSSLVISSIGAIIQSKLLSIFSVSKSSIPKGSLFFAETTNQGKLIINSRQITTVYGFYDEINRKYGNPNPWKYCTEVFDYLPIGAVVDGSSFFIQAKCFACMEDSARKSRQSTKSEPSIEKLKFLTKDLSVT